MRDDVFLPKDQLPPPPEGAEVLGMRYRMDSNDWWLDTTGGWFWLDQHHMTWKPSVYGPG